MRILAPSFHTPPELEDNPLVRARQEAFVRKVLDVTLPYPNVLYCMDNETKTPWEWAWYWGDFLKAEKVFAELVGQVPEPLRDDLDFWRAECSFRLGRLGEAETGFYGYLKRRPHGPRTDLAWQRLNLLTGQGG